MNAGIIYAITRLTQPDYMRAETMPELKKALDKVNRRYAAQQYADQKPKVQK